MTVSACLTVFWLLCIFGGLFILALALYCCIALRSNFRLFVIGMAGYAITDLVNTGIHKLSEVWGWLGSIYENNPTQISLVILFIQAFVFAGTAFIAIRYFRMTKGYYFRQGFAIGAGMAAMTVYTSFMRNHISNIILLAGYKQYLDGLATELTADEIAQTEQLAAELTATPVYKIIISVLELIFISAIIIALAYLAVTAILSKIRTNMFIAAVIYFVFTSALYFINTYANGFWIRVALEAVCAAGAVFYISKNYAPTPAPRVKKLR